MRRYLAGADTQISAALARTEEAALAWGIEQLLPLPGGAKSVVVAGRRGGIRVVLKVPLSGDARDEAIVLRTMPGAPAVLEETRHALLLEYLAGDTVLTSDDAALSEALATVSAMWSSTETRGFTAWSAYLHELIDEYANRIRERSTSMDLITLAQRVLDAEVSLATRTPIGPAHGDLQGKNLLNTS